MSVVEVDKHVGVQAGFAPSPASHSRQPSPATGTSVVSEVDAAWLQSEGWHQGSGRSEPRGRPSPPVLPLGIPAPAIPVPTAAMMIMPLGIAPSGKPGGTFACPFVPAPPNIGIQVRLGAGFDTAWRRSCQSPALPPARARRPSCRHPPRCSSANATWNPAIPAGTANRSAIANRVRGEGSSVAIWPSTITSKKAKTPSNIELRVRRASAKRGEANGQAYIDRQYVGRRRE